ncbi:MAG: hypothetical protein ACFFAE_17090 [Candidatus Hodarchaeota archaeon]
MLQYALLLGENRRIKRFIISHWVIIIVFFLWTFSLILRIIFASTTYGFIFSDEIIQSKEMAHRWLYGFGYVPWEFQIPSEFQEEGAARSPLHALFYAFLCLLGDTLNFPWHSTVRMITIVDAIVSSFVVPLIFLVSCQILKNSREIALITTLLTTTWFWMIFIGSHSFSNVYYTPLIFLSIWLLGRSSYHKSINEISESIENSKNSSEDQLKLRSLQHWLAGLSLGLAFCLRVDALLFFAIFIILYYRFNWNQWKNEWTLIWAFLFGFFISGILIVGFLDFWAFGVFWISPWNNFVFNIAQNKAQIFVDRPFSWYINMLFGRNSPFFPFFAFFLILMAIQVFVIFFNISNYNRSILTAIHERFTPDSFRPWLWIELPSLFDQLRFSIFIFLILIFFSLTPNKQLRFLYPWLPLFFTLLSLSAILFNNYIQWLFQVIYQKMRSISINVSPNLSKKKIYDAIIFIVCIGSWFITVQLQSMHVQNRTPINAWGDVLLAMTWIGEQEDSRGLLVFGTIAFGIFHLHKNIPIRYYFYIENVVDLIQEGIDMLPLVNKTRFNYVIVPRYSYDQEPELDEKPVSIYSLYPNLNETLLIVGYKNTHLIHVGKNVCEIWKAGS